MAANDVFLAKFHFEGPSRPASCGLYYREVTPNATEQDTCRDIALGMRTALESAILDILSSEWRFTAIQVDQVHPTVQKTAIDPPNNTYNVAVRPAVKLTTTDQEGNFNGGATEPALPANNTIQIDLIQETFSLKSNGRINFPGIPESQYTGANLNVPYVTTCDVLAALLASNVNSGGDAGVWQPVVVSAKVRDLAGPGNPKDWITSIAPITDANTNPIIAIQRRRATRVVGGVR